VQRWELSARLRSLRHEAGLTIEQVADSLMCSPAKVSRMETGLRTVQPRDVRDLAALYHLSAEEREALAMLAQGSKQKAWYDAYDVREVIREYYGLEAGAQEFRWVEPMLVPGLAQTPAYSSILLKLVSTLEDHLDLNPEEQVEIRSKRQGRLHRGEASYRFILAEEALRLKVGDAGLMLEQMDHLLEIAELPNVSLRILKSDSGLTLALVGSFILMSFRSDLPDVLFREGANYSMTTDPTVVDRYSVRFSALESETEGEAGSLELIKELREYWQSRA
jgi:transcriptional regulator with XRE-family HTH domain